MALDRPVVLACPPPTPNGPLHLGHLSGPYVACDVAARAARARGRGVLTMCGLDSNQNYVLAKALQEQRAAEQVARDYGELIREAFAGARIDHDIFVDPWDQPVYVRSVVELLGTIVKTAGGVSGKAPVGVCDGCGRTLHHAYVGGSCPVCGAESGGGTCEGCGAFTTALNLGGARCTLCGGTPRAETVGAPLLRLEDYRDQLLETWAGMDMPPRVWRLIRHYLAEGLPEVPLAYPTDWGIDASDLGLAGCRLDVWVEMGLGYAYAVARALDPDVPLDDLASAWRRSDGIWFFQGVDNTFYYGILFPALFAALGLPPTAISGIVVNEFYRLAGSKFSTSRNHAVWAHEFLQEEDPGLARLYLCWDRPDRYESDFTPAAYRAFCAWAEPLLAGTRTTGRWSDVVPVDVARNDLLRATRALDLPGFDPALAVRCLLGAAAADPAGVLRLLSTVTGDTPPGPIGETER